MENMHSPIAAAGAIALIAALLGFAATPTGSAHSDDTPPPVTIVVPVTDATRDEGYTVIAPTPAPVVVPVIEPVMEDDPSWDCRTMGNRTCGTLIEDTWYLVAFDADGKPVSVVPRG